MADYVLTNAPDSVNPFGPGIRARFSAANLTDAQAHAQAMSTMTQQKIVLEDSSSATAGVARYTYSPAAAGSSVTQVSSIKHK